MVRERDSEFILLGMNEVGSAYPEVGNSSYPKV